MKSDNFRSRPAKAGHGPRRKQLIEELRQAETCFFHSTIMCSGENPPADWVTKKDAFEAEMKAAEAELEVICRPENQKKLDAFRMK